MASPRIIDKVDKHEKVVCYNGNHRQLSKYFSVTFPHEKKFGLINIYPNFIRSTTVADSYNSPQFWNCSLKGNHYILENNEDKLFFN